jgi:hypothetical protein
MSKAAPSTPASTAPADATTAAVGAAPGPSVTKIHDASQQARLLRTALQDDKQRVGFFLGAGCPLGIYDDKGEKSLSLIPAVIPLTVRVGNGLGELDKTKGAGSKHKANWDCLHGECKGSGTDTPTVEDILTELRTLTNRRGAAVVAGLEKAAMAALDTEICGLILTAMKQSLPSHRCSYHRFASWIGGVQRQSPIEVFTPNYDLLFEQAFEQHPLPHFDGFVGSREPYFDLASIEHDAIPPRWTRLWKLHGSINWERLEEKVNGQSVTRVVRVTREADAGKVMIYPSHLKYDQSRRMPYLAMLDRLRAFFRTDAGRKDVGPPLLVICGYSFLDDHLNEVLLDGLRGNRKAHCVTLMFDPLAKVPAAVDCAEKLHNLTLLARNGAVVGSRKGLYRDGTAGGDEHNPWLYEEEEAGTDPANPSKCTRNRLGDFHFFGLFLEQLSGHRSGADHVAIPH